MSVVTRFGPTTLETNELFGLNNNHELDDFQKHSINAIINNQHVLVTAHTGSGKTVVAKYAIHYFNNKGKKVLYTSPIKTLSNQKYNEFKEEFSNVGLLTGDNKINPDGSCIIMTTEILRNSLFKNTENWENLGCVIFDEVHYINDPDRGKVWEETINLLHSDVHLILLSATIDKSEQFAAWIAKLKNKTVSLIPTLSRPVPLEHFILTDDTLFKIQDKNDNFIDASYDDAYRIYKKNQSKLNPHNLNNLNINATIKYLKDNNLMQTIFFSFSRKNCEKYASSVTISLLSSEEICKLRNTFDKYMHKYEKQYIHVPQLSKIKKLMEKGVCYHHSGLIPLLKEIIEIIFQEGLIKVLFATETFAVGVNMPTRTVVFTELEKNRRLLYTNEYKQMSGRAGRRGLDQYGYVILLPLYDFPTKSDLRKVLTGGLPKIESKFYLDYNFILKMKLCETKTIDEFLNDSLCYKDYSNQITNEENILADLETIYTSKKNLFESDDAQNKLINIQKYLKYSEMQEKLGVLLSQKQQKEIKNSFNQLQKNKELHAFYLDYLEFINLTKTYQNQQNKLNQLHKYFDNEIQNLTNIMQKFNYLTVSNKISTKGLIASEINECNSIILTELLTNNLLDGLTSEEICGLFSIFIDDIKTDEPITINNLNVSQNLKNNLHQLESIIDKYIDEEISNSINLYQYDYYAISYDYIEIAMLWASGSSINDILGKYGIYEGNFIRSMIKISNIVKTVILLATNYGYIKLIPILESIDGKIIRDIVNVNSLYL